MPLPNTTICHNWLSHYNCQNDHPTIDLNLMSNQSTCLNASITLSGLPIMMQTHIWATNMRWGATTLTSLQPFLVQCQIQLFATVDSHTILTNRNVMTKFGWLEGKSCKKVTNLTDNLNLMYIQPTCLNASITLSKLPIMMQTQIQGTNMRWRGMTLKSLQPCPMLMPNITICHNWLSHYNCQTEM